MTNDFLHALAFGFGLSSGIALLVFLTIWIYDKAKIAYAKYRDPFYSMREYR